ncbi:hypothetical protein ADUPG1_008076 [Aduncisulcus paluster]|uniref:Protein kinase domain-containing protein n=1 Tax=Aduncisulcus paluster TaxID=2918883 RepID=A0ABQ5KS06_9EUKA|nr:hypothetical protein ADUPG1_008076 [Aduncisulcus paluster]
MMKGERNRGEFTDISLPFSTSTPIKGACICIGGESSSSPLPSYLIFSLTSSKGEKIWFFLPIDLPDVVLCEITGRGRKEEYFKIESLIFICREETPEEIKSREAREKLWSEAPVVNPEFVKDGGRDSIPIPRNDPKLVDPSFAMIKCKDDSYSTESKYYDQSSNAQKMLKAEDYVSLSHLSIPFPSPSPMKGSYICVSKYDSSPSLLFTFTDCDGKKTFIKYKFTEPKNYYEWHFLPIDLANVVLCEIEGKGTWDMKNSRCFWIYSLVFLRGDDIPTSPALLTHVHVPFSSSKTPTSNLSLPSKPVKEIVIIGNDKDSAPKDTKQKKHKDKKKQNPKDGKPKYNPKNDSLTLTSESTLPSQCIIGSGGFGEVLLVQVDGIPFSCVLKKMFYYDADEKLVKYCRRDFKMQLELYNNPKCFNRITRPIYILDLMDSNMKGVYGFIMEFCLGGNVKDFARSWCSQGKYACYVRESTMGGTESDSTAVIHDHGDGNDGDEDDSDGREEELHSDSESYGSGDSDKNSDHSESSSSSSSRQSMRPVDLTLLDPLRICALCADIIQCVSDILKAKPDLIHRNIKPNNFLIRVDSTSKECTVVLDGIGSSYS